MAEHELDPNKWIDLHSDYTLSQTDELRKNIEALLKNKFDISHVTLQMEYNCCDEKEIIRK